MTKQEVATLGGGCFWCLEAAYEQLQGVDKVVSGYAGGHKENPTYHEVCDETTGHAEVVQLTFNPEVTSYREILEVFFTIHDPTTLNRQGNDVGESYRSIILTHSPEQLATAQAMIRELTDEKVFVDPIVTQVQPLTKFYPGEGYHQQYYRNNPMQPYCLGVVRPKLQKFKKRWTAKLKPT